MTENFPQINDTKIKGSGSLASTEETPKDQHLHITAENQNKEKKIFNEAKGKTTHLSGNLVRIIPNFSSETAAGLPS
jgi:hypothetical protein